LPEQFSFQEIRNIHVGFFWLWVQKWISIVAASQLVKGREAERELLMRWIDVVDYE